MSTVATPLVPGRDESAGQDRDVVTEQFYVTREYEKDTKTGKKSGGTKYDYFQKKGENSLRSYDDFREKEEGSPAMKCGPMAASGLRTVAVVSNFNANKYKANGKYYDYTYKNRKSTRTPCAKDQYEEKTSLYIFTMRIKC